MKMLKRVRRYLMSRILYWPKRANDGEQHIERVLPISVSPHEDDVRPDLTSLKAFGKEVGEILDGRPKVEKLTKL